MGAAVDLLAREMSETFHDMRSRLHGLTEGEFFWEPVSGSWTVFRREDGRWDHHYEEPDPEPAPFTTIAWRLTHLAMCKVMYHEHAFGRRELTWRTIETPATSGDAIEMLDTGHALLTEDLAAANDGELEHPRMTNWGEEWPAWRIFWTMVHHDAHHGGEIGALRDLYRVIGERS
ncbi:MAG: DinB family protein [Actinomycetota bacterium]